MKQKVAVILVWLGKLPKFHKMWCQSIKYNTSFDWFLITDDDEEENINFIKNISNIKYVYTTQNDIYKLIKEKCKINIEPNFKSYKLCDFRPLFGRMFDHLLKGYDYWAWTDNDVIYGDLHTLLLNKFDIFNVIGTGNCNRCSGPLCFFKNIDEINNLYKKLDKKLFIGKHKGVDEKDFSKLVKKFYYNKKLIHLGYKEHRWTNEILWYKGNFFDENNNILICAHFHFGGGGGDGRGGRRKEYRKNLEETVIHLNFPCNGLKFTHDFKASYYNQK